MLKKLNKKGFTLAELLVVVAIIGVLVAVSIPIFTSQLEKSREATDLANLRAAYAEVTTVYLTEDYIQDSTTGGTTTSGAKAPWTVSGDTYVAYYDAGKGTMSTAGTAIGKGTAATGSDSNKVTIGGFEYNPATSYAGQKIKCTILPKATDGQYVKVEFAN